MRSLIPCSTAVQTHSSMPAFEAFETPYLLGVGHLVRRQLLQTHRRDGAPAGGMSALAVGPADVAGLVDEASVGLGSVFPAGSEGWALVADPSRRFERDDASGIHDDERHSGERHLSPVTRRLAPHRRASSLSVSGLVW